MVEGNTVYIQNVSGKTDLEGTLKDNKPEWSYKRFGYDNNITPVML
jgi:hypothetical protein